MKTNILLRIIATAAFILCSFLPLSAQSKDDSLSKYNINNWKFGKVLHGKAINKSDLKGKVVVVEKWGAD